MDENRLIELETRLSYVDEAMQVLGDVVAGQGRRIEQLEALCRLLGDRLRQAEQGGGGGPPVDERPPHY